jgi:antitoxin YefM
MTNNTLSIREARERLTRLPEELARGQPTAISITRRGEPVLAVMPWDFYEALMETLEILGDDEALAALRQGVRDVAAGRVRSWDDVKAELHLDDLDDSADADSE